MIRGMKHWIRFLPIFLWLAVFGPVPAVGEYREFEDSEGRSIRAALVRASMEEVWIRREDGQSYRVPLERFSSEDQDYINRWRQLEQFRGGRGLEFNARRYVEERERASHGVVTSRGEETGYRITLRNRTDQPARNLRLSYRFYVERQSAADARPRTDRYNGEGTIPFIEAGGEEAFETSTATLVETRLASGWRYSNTNQRRHADRLRGVSVLVKTEDGVEIASFANPASLLETDPW